MPSSAWNGELQYLVTAVGESLPDDSAVRDFFQHDNWELVSVENTEDGHLVTLRTSRFSRIRCIIGGTCYPKEPVPPKKHTVDGHGVQTDLVFPDVYGCEVTAQERYLEVNVGHDVITRITNDKQQLDNFLDRIQLFGSKASCVCFKSTGHIIVTFLCSMKIQEWQWHLDIILTLITLLSPFKASLPTTSPLPVRDRCLAQCRSRPVHHLSSENCHTDAHIKVDKLFYVTISKDMFIRDMKTTYPELQFTSHADQVILEFSGRDDAVKRATQHILNHISGLSECHIQLTVAEAMMMESADVQNWFQQSLDSKNFCGIWELTSSDTGASHQTYSRSKRKCIKIVTSSTDPQPDITAFKQIFETCFQTAEVTVANSHIPRLESDSWKRFLADLHRSREEQIAPVLNVEQNKIAICDKASNIRHTRRAVLDFFERNVIDSHPELFEQEVTEVITDLHPWQIKLLATAQVQKQLPACLQQQTMTANPELKTVDIHGPLHTVDKYVIALWKYISSLSQQEIPLTAASMQVLQRSDTRERVQSVLDKERIVCDWHVQQDQLVISTHHICMQRVKNILMSEIETTQNRQQEDKQLQAEDMGIRTTLREHVDDQPQQCTQHQTADIPTESLKTRVRMRQCRNEVQTEKSKLKTKEKQTQICAQYKGVQSSEYKVQTKKLQTHTRFRHLQRGHLDERNVDTEEKQERGLGTVNTPPSEDMDMENNHTLTQSQEEMEESQIDNTETYTLTQLQEEMEESQADDTDAQETWRHQRAEDDLSDTDDPPSFQETPEEGPQLSLTRTAHQTSHEVTAHGPHLHNLQSSAPSTEEFSDQPELEIPSGADFSFRLPNSPVSSQGNRMEDSGDDTRAGSSHDLVPQQPGCPERPHNTGPASPQLWEDPQQSPMVSDARAPPARGRAERPPGQLQQLRRPHPQRRLRSSAGRPEADDSAGTSLTRSRPAAKRRANAPPSFPQNKRLCGDRRGQPMQRQVYTVEADELTDFSTQAEYQWQQNSPRPIYNISTAVATATANTSNNTVINNTSPNGRGINNNIRGINNNNMRGINNMRDINNNNIRGINNSINNSQFQAGSCFGARLTRLQTRVSRMEILSRLSQLENRMHHVERELVQEPVVHSEIRMVNIQHQLGDIMQRLDDINRQQAHGDSNSVIMSIANFSDRGSSPSTSISLRSEQQQHPQ